MIAGEFGTGSFAIRGFRTKQRGQIAASVNHGNNVAVFSPKFVDDAIRTHGKHFADVIQVELRYARTTARRSK